MVLTPRAEHVWAISFALVPATLLHAALPVAWVATPVKSAVVVVVGALFGAWLGLFAAGRPGGERGDDSASSGDARVTWFVVGATLAGLSALRFMAYARFLQDYALFICSYHCIHGLQRQERLDKLGRLFTESADPPLFVALRVGLAAAVVALVLAAIRRRSSWLLRLETGPVGVAFVALGWVVVRAQHLADGVTAEPDVTNVVPLAWHALGMVGVFVLGALLCLRFVVARGIFSVAAAPALSLLVFAAVGLRLALDHAVSAERWSGHEHDLVLSRHVPEQALAVAAGLLLAVGVYLRTRTTTRDLSRHALPAFATFLGAALLSRVTVPYWSDAFVFFDAREKPWPELVRVEACLAPAKRGVLFVEQRGFSQDLPGELDFYGSHAGVGVLTETFVQRARGGRERILNLAVSPTRTARELAGFLVAAARSDYDVALVAQRLESIPTATFGSVPRRVGLCSLGTLDLSEAPEAARIDPATTLAGLLRRAHEGPLNPSGLIPQ